MLKLAHKNLDVWKLLLELIKEIYELTNKFPKEELFGITSQLRRASISAASNYSEGCARISNVETKRFLEISRSSIVEIDTQLEISVILKFCIQEELIHIDELLNRNFAMLTNLMKKYS